MLGRRAGDVFAADGGDPPVVGGFLNHLEGAVREPAHVQHGNAHLGEQPFGEPGDRAADRRRDGLAGGGIGPVDGVAFEKRAFEGEAVEAEEAFGVGLGLGMGQQLERRRRAAEDLGVGLEPGPAGDELVVDQQVVVAGLAGDRDQAGVVVVVAEVDLLLRLAGRAEDVAPLGQHPVFEAFRQDQVVDHLEGGEPRLVLGRRVGVGGQRHRMAARRETRQAVGADPGAGRHGGARLGRPRHRAPARWRPRRRRNRGSGGGRFSAAACREFCQAPAPPG